MSELLQFQFRMTVCLGKLYVWADANGYGLTLGEGWRTPEQVAIDVANGKGIAGSLHPKRLAQDLNAFKDGVQITTVDGYRALGEYWKSLDPLCRWGGDFTTRPDADHFSITSQGVQ